MRSEAPALFRYVGLVLALLVLAGCGPRTEDYVKVIHEQRAALDEVTEVLARVRDEESMAEARKELQARQEQYETHVRRARDLPPPTGETRRRLEEEGFALQRALERQRAEVRRILTLPGGEEFLQPFNLPGQAPVAR